MTDFFGMAFDGHVAVNIDDLVHTSRHTCRSDSDLS